MAWWLDFAWRLPVAPPPMTHPLTPREQYEQAKRDFNNMRDDGTIGDHAELARWIDDYERDAAIDAEDDGDLSHVDDGLREFPMRKVKALTAEVAALRERGELLNARCARLHEQSASIATRATEAERKLAMAVEALEGISGTASGDDCRDIALETLKDLNG